jgi:2-oxoglutarate dehydrogenase E2 component (dihydrolipoamide succinyltransferase)
MTSIQMPQLGETIVEGTILKWLKAEGEQVERDEPLFEISTDKVDTEVPSPVAGTLTKIIVPEGETVPVGTELATIDDGAASAGEAAPSAAAATPETSEPETAAAEEAAAPPPAAATASPAAAGASAGASAGGATPLPDRGPRSQILSPLVRRLAQERGIDLSTVTGTGTGGRITKADVLAAVPSGGGEPAAAQPATPAAPAAQPVATAVAPPSVATGAAEGETVEPMTHIRKAIAAHMLASVNETARAWTMVEVDVDHLVKLRERTKEAFLATHGVKLTYLPFVVRATVDALKAFPVVNSRIDGENVVTPRAVHMGIAVSYDAGLIVPVIKNADAMNSVGIARAISDLAARARAHQLKPDEVQGSTFAITNPGPYGSLLSVPIINQPNVGILALDAIQKRPVVVEGDAIAVRNVVYVSMSWDHRLLDGEVATRFLARVKHNLETWDFAEDLGV